MEEIKGEVKSFWICLSINSPSLEACGDQVVADRYEREKDVREGSLL